MKCWLPHTHIKCCCLNEDWFRAFIFSSSLFSLLLRESSGGFWLTLISSKMCCFLYVELVRFVFFLSFRLINFRSFFHLFLQDWHFRSTFVCTCYMKFNIWVGFSPSIETLKISLVSIFRRFYCTKSAYMMNILIDLHTSLSFCSYLLSSISIHRTIFLIYF